MSGRSHASHVVDQFGAQATAYVTSAVHAGGADLDRIGAVIGALPGARALDLLGAGFADRFPESRVRYVLYNPLFVDSGMHRNFGQPLRAIIGTAARLFGARPAASAVPLKALLEEPPTARLTALRRGTAIAPDLDRDDAARLYARLAELTS